MSVWSCLEGTVIVPKEKHFSIRKYTEDFYDEVNITINGDKVYLTVCLDGLEAAAFIDRWIKGIPGTVDITASIRYLK